MSQKTQYPPEWYWKNGLHDAQILSVGAVELAVDWSSAHPLHNCLEICLDATGALFDSKVKKILLYNYKIKTPDVDLNILDRPFWINDELTLLPNNRFLLTINVRAFGKHDHRHKQFSITFDEAKVKRNI